MIKLCYLHNKIKNFSIHKEIFLDEYLEHDVVNIKYVKKADPKYNLFLVDLEKVDKKVSTLVTEFFADIEAPLIYFLLPKEYKTSLIQLAFMVDAKSVITTIQDTKKVIAKIEKDFVKHQEYVKALSLGSSLINHHSYMIYKDEKFSYASKQLLRDLKCKDMKELQRKVDRNIDVKKFFVDDEPVKRFISTEISKDSTFFIKSIRSGNYTLVSFELNNDYEPKQENQNYISGRLTYIEFLKDKVLEKMVADKLLSILTIDISEASNKLAPKDEEIFIKNFLHEVEMIIDSKLILAQYDADLYVVLFEDISFMQMQKKAQNYYLQILNFLNKQNLDIDAHIYAINITDPELEPILKTLDAIAENDLDAIPLDSSEVEYINDFQKNMGKEDKIHYLLSSIYENKNDLKLLNIYDGMSITTSSKILKKTDELLYVRVEELQSYVMDMDKITILQSSVLTKSVKANVKYICQKEKYAILYKFRMLDYNPNERLHGRVKSAKLIPVVISLTGSRVKGELIDISAKSIALKVKKTKAMKNILNQEINLIFYIENIRDKGASIKIEESVVVIYESEPMEDGSVKLVCLFDEDMENEGVIIDYVFNRQKSIIQSIKYLVK
ncbi:MAG: PilZ domain-containing protein [Campylobacterales bacterium]